MKAETKQKLEEKFYAAKEWAKENKDVVIAVAPSLIMGAVEVIKILAKKGYVSEEKKFRTKYVYDRDNGHYYELKRRPSNTEWLLIDQRKEVSDIPLGVVLDNMGLLK